MVNCYVRMECKREPFIRLYVLDTSTENLIYLGSDYRVTFEQNIVEYGYLFIRNLAYNVRHFVVPINSSLLALKFYSSVITTLIYNDTLFSLFHDFVAKFDSISSDSIIFLEVPRF